MNFQTFKIPTYSASHTPSYKDINLSLIILDFPDADFPNSPPQDTFVSLVFKSEEDMDAFYAFIRERTSFSALRDTGSIETQYAPHRWGKNHADGTFQHYPHFLLHEDQYKLLLRNASQLGLPEIAQIEHMHHAKSNYVSEPQCRIV